MSKEIEIIKDNIATNYNPFKDLSIEVKRPKEGKTVDLSKAETSFNKKLFDPAIDYFSKTINFDEKEEDNGPLDIKELVDGMFKGPGYFNHLEVLQSDVIAKKFNEPVFISK